MATARSDRVRRSINCESPHVFVSRTGDLDLAMGGYGSLTYMENTGTTTAPVFVARTGSANPLDSIDAGDASAPALGDLDGDGTRKPRPSTDKLRLHNFMARAGDLDLLVGDADGLLNYIENTGTSTAPVFTSSGPWRTRGCRSTRSWPRWTTTTRTPGRARF